MKTELILINDENLHSEDMQRAGQWIADGELVAFPTETVYGLGGDALNPRAAEKIYAAKGRPSDNPLIVHIAEFEQLESIAANPEPKAKKLAFPFPKSMERQFNAIV